MTDHKDCLAKTLWTGHRKGEIPEETVVRAQKGRLDPRGVLFCFTCKASLQRGLAGGGSECCRMRSSRRRGRGFTASPYEFPTSGPPVTLPSDPWWKRRAAGGGSQNTQERGWGEPRAKPATSRRLALFMDQGEPLFLGAEASKGERERERDQLTVFTNQQEEKGTLVPERRVSCL